MYGQQITVPEQVKNNPSIYNNTSERFLLQNRLPLTMVLEPTAHFNKENHTEFKIFLGKDSVYKVDGTPTSTSGHNTFGQGVTYNSEDIIYNSSVTGTSLKIDRIYDVYIESITTYNTVINTSKHTMSFLLQINDWNIDNKSNVGAIESDGSDMARSVIIPNETTAINTTQTHKAKKLNYLTHLTPDTITSISGKLSFLDGKKIFEEDELHDTRIFIELVLIPRNKN